MIRFDPVHSAVHHPPDRRFRIWIRPSVLIALVVVCLLPLIAAYMQWLAFGLPHIQHVGSQQQYDSIGVHGFPAWIRYGHFFNFLFVTILIRSGLSILMDHPRLYFNDHCTPGSEWIRFTPLKVPTDRLWTAKDDARYISPLLALPGYRHTVGVARAWHFVTVYGYVIDGILFITLLLITPQWRRLVPTSLSTFSQAWAVFVHYVTFHFPPEPDGFYGYNALQQLTYFVMIFVFGVGTIMTGLAMSPAVVNHFSWYPKLFGGRQAARSIHFLWMVGFVLFIIAHVTLVVLTGFARNMNHIVMGTDDTRPIGMILGFVGIAVVIGSWFIAHYISWFAPRTLQRVQRTINTPLLGSVLSKLVPRARYSEKKISPHFWPNGKLPVREDWKRLAAGWFRDFKLKIGGRVANPVELSLDDLRRMATAHNITMHHCIQGWSGIAAWSGVPMKTIADLVKPEPSVRVVAFFSFGPGLYTPSYYDTQTMANAMDPDCILALNMKGKPLTEVYGAPLRLRVENQLGYKMVKWIERIEFLDSAQGLGLGEGGTNEDNEYFDLIPYI